MNRLKCVKMSSTWRKKLFEKSSTFFENLVDSQAGRSLYTAHQRGRRAAGDNVLRSWEIQRDVHREVISKAGSPVRRVLRPDPTADKLSFGSLVL